MFFIVETLLLQSLVHVVHFTSSLPQYTFIFEFPVREDFSWPFDDLMPTRTQEPPVIYFGFKTSGGWPKTGKITRFLWLLIVSIFPWSSVQQCGSCTLTHTHTRARGNNVDVNFKWMARWFSLSQVKKETISIIERGCLLHGDVFQVIWNHFKSFLYLVNTVPSESVLLFQFFPVA